MYMIISCLDYMYLKYNRQYDQDDTDDFNYQTAAQENYVDGINTSSIMTPSL